MKYLILLSFFTEMAFAHALFRGNLKGTDLPCSIEIEEVYYLNNIETPANLRVDVIASLEDDHDHGDDFFFTLKPTGRADLFSGLGDNGRDQLNLIINNGIPDFSDLNLYALKWWHINHFHSAQCVNLSHVE